jgi:hypothetical protein
VHTEDGKIRKNYAQEPQAFIVSTEKKLVLPEQTIERIVFHNFLSIHK